MPFRPLDDNDKNLKYGDKTFSISNNTMKNVLNSNGIFSPNELEYYTKFNRFGFLNPYTTSTENIEYLFFTKPDLYLFDNTNSYSSMTLRPELQDYPIFADAANMHKDALTQLQYSARDRDNRTSPFMCLLSNSVTSRLNLPSISSDNTDSSANIYGTSIQYRGHSLKSDNGYDFTLSFNDTIYKEIYTMVKIYDEYMRLLKLGYISPNRDHIINRILPEQFSIYKFVVGVDGETILFYAKVTGVFFTDVPRNEFDDAPQDGFKYSLSFHGQFPEEEDPKILNDFNFITTGSTNSIVSTDKTFSNGRINNSWARTPVIVKEHSERRAQFSGGNYNYKLKWTN